MRWLDLAHRWTGGLIGLLLALIGISGALLVHRDFWTVVPHKTDAQVQETSEVAHAVTTIMAEPSRRPEAITFASPGFGVDRLVYEDGSGAYTDQTGQILLKWESQWARPELWLSDFHKNLLGGEIGHVIIGAMGLVGLAFVLTGMILWWRTRRTFAFRILPKRMSRPAILRHHRDLGIVATPLLLLSFITGTALVFRPLSSVVLGPGAAQAIAEAARLPDHSNGALATNIDWGAMLREARRRFPNAEFRTLSLPRKGRGLIAIRMKQPWEWLPNGRSTLWFAADTGVLIKARNPARSPAQVRAYSLLYPLHAGKIGGLAYRLVMTVSGLVLALLGTLAVWTFWFRRKLVHHR